MSELMEQARDMIVSFKGKRYAFGTGVLDRIGPMTAQVGRKALLVGRVSSPWLKPALVQLLESLNTNGVEILGQVQGAAPNAPREDVYRIHGYILHKRPNVLDQRPPP